MTCSILSCGMQIERVVPLVSEKLQAFIRDQAAESNANNKRKRSDSAKVRANKQIAADVRPKQRRRSV